MIDDFKLRHDRPVYQQITEFLRDQIVSDRWTPGSRLPAIQKLAEAWGTNYRTVYLAMDPLVKEGLLVRRQGSGTYVRERSQRVVHAGIYICDELWKGKGTEFFRLVCDFLQQAFTRSGLQTTYWVDSRPEMQQKTSLPALMRAIDRHELHCLAVCGYHPIANVGLEQLPIPTSFGSPSTHLPCRVQHDVRQIMRDSLAELARNGCRTVGLVTHIHSTPNSGDYQFERNVEFFEEYLDAVKAFGLTTKSAWIAGPKIYEGVSEMVGYEGFRRIWAQDAKPEGLLVFPDVLARGVVTAIYECGVSVPRDLKVVFHRNAETEFPCPFPVAWIEASAKEFAEAQFAQIQKQLAGQPVHPVILPMRLRPAPF